MRIARATMVAFVAFLAGTAVLEVLALFCFVGYGGTTVGRAVAYSALPVVIFSTTFAVLQAQRSLGNSDWRQAVMVVKPGQPALTAEPEYQGLPPSHWGIPEPSPQEEQLAGMAESLPFWSSAPIQAWSGPVEVEAATATAPLPRRSRAGAESVLTAEEAPFGHASAELAALAADAEGVTTVVLPAPDDEASLAEAVSRALREAGLLSWPPKETTA